MTEHDVLTGGCLCGGVRYAYSGPLGGSFGAVTLCHCAMCRRASGYAAAVGPVAAAGFQVTAGQDLIRQYESSPGKVRAFCGRCGSPFYSRRDNNPDALRLRIGSLDAPPPSLKIEAHIFTADAPAWTDADDAPRYPGFEPGRS